MRAYNPPRFRCGAVCQYGGLGAARKYSRAELELWGACNASVRSEGERCYRHKAADR